MRWRIVRCLRFSAIQLNRRPQPQVQVIARWQSTSSLTTGSITPTLLARAETIAKEHSRVSDLIADSFDAKAAQRLGPLSRTRDALQQYNAAHTALDELNQILADTHTDPDIRALGQEDLQSSQDALASATNALKLSLVPDHQFAHLPCLLEIRPGAGGDEAALFANDLLKMYTSFCTQQALSCTIISREYSDASSVTSSESALQSAILEISSPNSYGRLRSEAGVHRVQRIPSTDSKGRVQTSAVSILVLPSFDQETSFTDDDYSIDPKDVRTDIMRARGAGGQHVNTTCSAVRLTHLPTGTVVAIQDSRSQPKNREKAWTLLRARIAQQVREERDAETLKLRRSVVGVAKMGRGDKVRTYNWNQRRVTDHRSGVSAQNLEDVLSGGEGLQRLMQSVAEWLAEQDVLGLVAEEAESAKS